MEILNIGKWKDKRPRRWKVLLYPDNPAHLKAFKMITRQQRFKDYCIYAYHVERDELGHEILQGHGKKHCHMLFDFPYGHTMQALCNSWGLTPQFVWPMGYELKTEHYKTNFVRTKHQETLEKGFLYLLHYNRPNLTQYPLSWLSGSPQLVTRAKDYIVQWQASQVSERQALKYVRLLLKQCDGVVKFEWLFDTLVDTPYYKALRSPLCQKLLEAHNQPYYLGTSFGWKRDLEDDRAASIVQRSQIVHSSAVGVDWYSEFGEEPPF